MIPGREGLIPRNVEYLDCLSDDQSVDLLDSVIHEALHFTRSPELQMPPDFDHNYVVPEAAPLARRAIKVALLAASNPCYAKSWIQLK